MEPELGVGSVEWLKPSQAALRSGKREWRTFAARGLSRSRKIHGLVGC
jgi:hypothetical protein